MAEQEVYDHLRRSGGAQPPRRRGGQLPRRRDVRPLRAGADRHAPGRSEFLTPYTPYQPEISQGGLQVMFEFQTAISELTGLPVSNASRVRGPERGGRRRLPREARDQARPKLVASRGLHPHSRAALAHARGRLRHGGRGGAARRRAAPPTSRRSPPRWTTTPRRCSCSSRTSSAPWRTSGALAEAGKRTGALLVCAADPLPLGILKPPGELGVDVCVGEGQTLGNRLDFGGPSFGFFAADERFIRKMPGRIAGETRDVDGRAASCSRSRRASSTSAARRPRTTSAPRRR